MENSINRSFEKGFIQSLTFWAVLNKENDSFTTEWKVYAELLKDNRQ